MSAYALPLMYFNLGGEMIYIIDQRLRAQNVTVLKKIRVIEDLLKAMFDQNVVKTMYNSGSLFSNETWKALFDKIAHSSIMKLNSTSMSRLYDLMIMAVKYQVTACKRPQDVLLIALNHLDQMKDIIVSNVPTLSTLFSPIYDQLKLQYASLSAGSFMFIRSSMLQFFKDYKIRVSLFLKDNLQDDRGMFKIDVAGELPIGFNIPGKIKVHALENGQMDVDDFDCGISHLKICRASPSYEPSGDRVISLGKNMYLNMDYISNSLQSQKDNKDILPCENLVLDSRAKSQIEVLTQLLGVNANKSNEMNKASFQLDLFDVDVSNDEINVEPVQRAEQDAKKSDVSNVFKIDASKRKENVHLSKIMEEMSIKADEDDKEDDLFDFPDDI